MNEQKSDQKDMGPTLTNQGLYHRFSNQFELVAYAIAVATNRIKTGRAIDEMEDTKNLPNQVLKDIRNGTEVFEEEEASDEIEEIRESVMRKVQESLDAAQE